MWAYCNGLMTVIDEDSFTKLNELSVTNNQKELKYVLCPKRSNLMKMISFKYFNETDARDRHIILVDYLMDNIHILPELFEKLT